MYWKSVGPTHTAATVGLALDKAAASGITDIVVASNTGKTAALLAGSGLNIVCVTHVQGFAKAGENEMSETVRSQLISQGVKVLTTSHALSGVERGISRKFGGVYPAELIANTLRMLGQGVKVCVEISLMALDAGMVPHGKDIIAIGGTGSGADTAVILRPGHSAAVFDTVINEIICKP
jgi:uncharacterized protein